MNKKGDKKLIGLVLSIIFISGCGVDNPIDEGVETNEIVVETDEPTTEPIVAVINEYEEEVTDTPYEEPQEVVTTTTTLPPIEEAEEPESEDPGYTLADYPNMFIEDNSFNAFLVVGNEAPAKDVIVVSDIAVSLQYAGISVETTKLVSEIDDIRKQNLILIGTPCNNELIANVMDIESPECVDDYSYGGFDENEGIIALYEKYEHIYLVISGYLPSDTREAGVLVANYGDYNLEDNLMKINTTVG